MAQCQTETSAQADRSQTAGADLPDERTRAIAVNEGLDGADLHRGMTERVEGRSVPFRISPEPFWIPADLFHKIESLGPHLLKFYEAANRLYLHSVRGNQPDWVRDYLERGKTETVLDYQKMRRFRTDLPALIRPDIIPTKSGLVLSELDAVPGGFGLLAALSNQYERLGYEVIGGADGIPERFWAAVTEGVDAPDPLVAIIVSDESDDYRGEMTWLASRLREMGRRAVVRHPRELTFTEEGLYTTEEPGRNGAAGGPQQKIDVVYRFFELFDLKNIPKIDLILYAVRKELVKITPPIKSHLEEKQLLALAHHGELAEFWRQQMGKESYERCRQVFPRSWVVDPRPLPPHAVIPGLEIGGRPLNDWRRLKEATQKERKLVLKPSGFSENAWGSRGVMVGHDMPGEAWAEGIEQALASFETTPYVLQEFHKGRTFRATYFDFEDGQTKTVNGRVRLCPYYFVEGGKTHLAGILATVCPPDKKVIHGMSDAIMAPVGVR